MKKLFIMGLVLVSFNTMAKDTVKVQKGHKKAHPFKVDYSNSPGYIRGKGITTLKIKGVFSYAASSTGGELSLYNIHCQTKAKVCVASVQVISTGIQNELQTLRMITYQPGVFLLVRETGLSFKRHWYHIDTNRGLAFDVIEYKGPKGKTTLIYPITQYKYGYNLPLERQN